MNFECCTFWNHLSWDGLSISHGAESEWVLLDQDVLWILCDLFGDINSNHQFLSCSEQMLWCSSGREGRMEGKAALHHLSWSDSHGAPTSPCALLRTLVSCCHWPDFSLQSSTQQSLHGRCSAQACLALLPVPLCFLPSSHFPFFLFLNFSGGHYSSFWWHHHHHRQTFLSVGRFTKEHHFNLESLKLPQLYVKGQNKNKVKKSNSNGDFEKSLVEFDMLIFIVSNFYPAYILKTEWFFCKYWVVQKYVRQRCTLIKFLYKYT